MNRAVTVLVVSALSTAATNGCRDATVRAVAVLRVSVPGGDVVRVGAGALPVDAFSRRKGPVCRARVRKRLALGFREGSRASSRNVAETMERGASAGRSGRSSPVVPPSLTNERCISQR